MIVVVDEAISASYSYDESRNLNRWHLVRAFVNGRGNHVGDRLRLQCLPELQGGKMFERVAVRPTFTG